MDLSRNNQLRQGLSLSISILIHALLFLYAYYWIPSGHVVTSPNKNYSVQLRRVAAPTSATSEVNTDTPTSKSKAVDTRPKASKHKKKATIADQPKTSASKKVKRPKTKPKDNTPPAPKPIDERGLYTNTADQQVGAVLEITGWTWDVAPQPKDDTAESGKLVFEIKIDDMGEVIAVKTLEKTVSPVVEKIYKDALTVLTFSKTPENTAQKSYATGKVTFILRTK